MATKIMWRFGIQRHVVQINPNGKKVTRPRMFYGDWYSTALEAVQANVEYMAKHPGGLCAPFAFPVECDDENEEMIPK